MNRACLALLIVISTLLSCEKKISDKQFEQDVLSEIFLKVADSTYKDKRLYTSFPASAPLFYDQSEHPIALDSIEQHKRDIDHENTLAAIRSDTLNLIIAIKSGGMITEKTALHNYNTRKFIFKHLSELPATTDYENWTAKYPKFAGVLAFSHITFDAKREKGFLDVGYYCGLKCGLGYRVTIKKVDDKWLISKVEDTWIL
jgi:hypothetical protein